MDQPTWVTHAFGHLGKLLETHREVRRGGAGRRAVLQTVSFDDRHSHSAGPNGPAKGLYTPVSLSPNAPVNAFAQAADGLIWAASDGEAN